MNKWVITAQSVIGVLLGTAALAIQIGAHIRALVEDRDDYLIRMGLKRPKAPEEEWRRAA